jgi:hypothetical protein
MKKFGQFLKTFDTSTLGKPAEPSMPTGRLLWEPDAETIDW